MKRDFPQYKEWVQGRRCAVCSEPPPSEAHHLKGDFHASGVGLKAPDYLAMPLCRRCHMEMHNATPGWREAQREALLRTLISAIEVGMLEVPSVYE